MQDGVSLMAGLLFVLLAVVFLVDDLTGVDVDGRWAAPVVLVAVGAVGLLSTLRPAMAQRAERDPTAP
jgi:uncharacterized integral membrane protein